MLLTTLTADRLAFDKAAIMRHAHHEGRFALAACRTIAERRRQLSIWLRKAWAVAKGEASELRQRAEREADVRAALAQRARDAIVLAASYGNDAAAIRQAIASEHYRDRMNFAAVDRLQAALNQIGA
jgi:uncharacterized protein (UPF0335 family)